MKNKRDIGTLGEKVAAKYLERKGYEILFRNWTCHWGELDLVARISDELVFVEVKYSRNRFFPPNEQYTFRKQAHVLRSINNFLMKHPKYRDSWRLDLICVLRVGKVFKVTRYENVLS